MLHQTTFSHSASFSNCILQAWMDSLIYKIKPPPILHLLSLVNITFPVIPNSASDILVVAQDYVIHIMSGSISSTIMFRQFPLFIMLLAFKQTHLKPNVVECARLFFADLFLLYLSVPPVFVLSVNPPANLVYLVATCPTIHRTCSQRTLLRPLHLDGGHLSRTYFLSEKKYPHKSMNPNPSSSYICSTRALIFILLQFLCDAPLPPNSGKIPKRLIFSTIVFFNFPTNSLYLCTILVLPSVYALFVPTCTNIDHPWPFPNVFSTRSVTGSIQAPVRQTTKYSPLLKVLSVFRNNGTAYKYPFCSQ